MENVSKDRVIFNDKMLLIQEEPRGASMIIEIPVVAAVGIVKLPVIQELTSDLTQNVVIKSLRLITDGELTNAPTIGGITAPLTELVKISLTMYAEGWQKGYLIPITSLNNTFIEGSGIPYREKTTKLNNWQKVEWNKCTLNWSNGTIAAGFPYTVLLEVEYVRFDKLGKEITGPTV